MVCHLRMQWLSADYFSEVWYLLFDFRACVLQYRHYDKRKRKVYAYKVASRA